MCLIAFALDSHPEYPFILVANRDEFYARPTMVADFWSDHPSILGGRDVQAGGTWMAINKANGRFAAVTNYRDLQNIREDAKSRGDLPVNYLLTSQDSASYLEEVHGEAQAYNGFNLLVYQNGQMHHYSNYENKINTLGPGIYGLSNALLDTNWPKVARLKERFRKTIEGDFDHESLLHLLSDRELADDDLLPDTGVGHDLEKMLSSICIQSEKYGTCCSTILTISRTGEVKFTERSYPVGDRKGGDVFESFDL